VTLTGLCPAAPIGLAGGQAGDALILTRALGSGVIMAAEMAGAARGRDVAALLEALCQPQGAAAGILRAHAHAMTDVTGFGLAGHLAGMARAAGLSARLVRDIPAYQGVADLLSRGHGSQLAAANRAAAPVFGAETLGALAGILHDPQTAGPLLAAVPAPVAARLVAELQAAGYPAQIIGALVAGPPGAITLD
jgi:selenide,water dikinase